MTSGAVIVTGAASGIGRALTRRLLDDGWTVCACDISASNLETLGSNPRLLACALDVRDRAAVQAAVDEAEAAAGSIHGLVACAAVFHAKPFLELDDALWDETFEVNLTGSLLAIQAVLPSMRRRHLGSIIVFSSNIARNGGVGAAHYGATKGGLLGLGRSVALETARDGIRVNIVSPGVTDTPQPRGHMTEAELFSRAKTIPLGRIGTPEDMVETVLFLLSDDASFITGQDIRVTGGSRLF